VFPFPTKKQSTPRRLKLVHIGCDKSSEEQQDSDPEIVEMPSSESEEPAQSEVTAQLEAAQNKLMKLRQLLDGARLEIVELTRLLNLGRTLQGKGLALRCSEDVNFYTGLPSGAVFDTLLQYLTPGATCSNVVYRPTAQKWASDCEGGVQPGEVEWRELVNQEA